MILEMLVSFAARVDGLLIISLVPMRVYICVFNSLPEPSPSASDTLITLPCSIQKKKKLALFFFNSKGSRFKNLLNLCSSIRSLHTVDILSLQHQSHQRRANREPSCSQCVQASRYSSSCPWSLLFSNLFLCPGLTGWRWGEEIKRLDCLLKRRSQFQDGFERGGEWLQACTLGYLLNCKGQLAYLSHWYTNKCRCIWHCCQCNRQEALNCKYLQAGMVV